MGFLGGVTNNLDRRLNEHSKQGLNLTFQTLYFEDGAIPQKVEGEWVRYVRSVTEFWVPRNQLLDGASEAVFTHPGLKQFMAALMKKWEPLSHPAQQ